MGENEHLGRVPDPTPTSRGPVYEGRLLDRPHDEVVDQGASFDMRTLLSRRGLLSVAGLGVGAMTLAACGVATEDSAVTGGGATRAGASSLGEVPEETNGPYPADGTNDVNVLEDSGIERSDIRSSLDGGATAAGVPFALTMNVRDMVNDLAPFVGAAVYAWQCDAQGRYSMYSQGVERETFLRGLQVTDAAGNVTFQTIVPGCYAGRWTHIHFEVYADRASATNVDNVIATSQIAFPADMLPEVYALDAYAGSAENLAGVGTRITDDNIFGDGDDWSSQVPSMSGSVRTGFRGSLEVRIDTSTEPSGSGGSGPGPGGGPGDRGAPGAPPGPPPDEPTTSPVPPRN